MRSTAFSDGRSPRRAPTLSMAARPSSHAGEAIATSTWARRDSWPSSRGPPVAIAPLPPPDRLSASFQDRLDFVLRLVDGPRSFHRSEAAVGLEHNDPLGIAEHRDVGVVRDEDQLPLAADSANAPDHG